MANWNTLTHQQLAEALAISLSRLEASEERSELERLTQELHTHQIELEMQNRQLRDSQQQLEQSHNRYVDLYDFAPVGYLTLNDKGSIVDLNLAAASLLGRERALLIEQPMTRWLVPESRLPLLNHLRQVLAQQLRHSTVDLQLMGREGTAAYDIQLDSICVEDDGRLLCRTAMIDIYERKRMIEQLMLAKEQAEQANAIKQKFLNRMNHEFRTPMNHFLGFAQLLEWDLQEPLTQGQTERLQEMSKAGWMLVESMSELLDFSALEVHTLTFDLEATEVSRCLQATLARLRPRAAERGVTLQEQLEGCSGQWVETDPLRLQQILRHLLSNAIKYSPPSGSVSLHCESTDAGTLRIMVTDSGPGISEADIDTLFEPFGKLYLNTYAPEGAGIGLALAKQLVELMGGTIGVRSQLGHGSTFWIELPLVERGVAH